MTWRRALTIAVFAVGLAPLGWLVWAGSVGHGLGANPIERITHVTGEWALRFLLASLAVTPLRQLAKLAVLAPLRRTLGLFAFFYAALHVATYAFLDTGLDLDAIAADVTKRPYIMAGLLAFLSLVPLAVTSTRGWQKRLGRRWIKLHRLVFVAATSAVVHFLWLVKSDLRPPLLYAGVLLLLVGWRVRHALSKPRAQRSPVAPALDRC